MKENNYGSFLIIPAYVIDHPEIDDATAILFGRLNALSTNRGYCFASDKYIANLSKCGDRVITDRFVKLKNLGFIKIFTVKVGMFWKRRIYTCNHYSAIDEVEIKEFLTKGNFMPLDGHTDALSEGTSVPHINIREEKDKKEEKKKGEKESSAIASPPSFFSYKEIKIEMKALEGLVEKYGESLIEDKLEDIWLYEESKGGKRLYKNYAAVLEKWIKKDLQEGKSPASKESLEEKNQVYLDGLKKKLNTKVLLKSYAIELEYNYVQIMAGNYVHARYETRDKNFIPNVKASLMARGISEKLL